MLDRGAREPRTSGRTAEGLLAISAHPAVGSFRLEGATAPRLRGREVIEVALLGGRASRRRGEQPDAQLVLGRRAGPPDPAPPLLSPHGAVRGDRHRAPHRPHRTHDRHRRACRYGPGKGLGLLRCSSAGRARYRCPPTTIRPVGNRAACWPAGRHLGGGISPDDHHRPHRDCSVGGRDSSSTHWGRCPRRRPSTRPILVVPSSGRAAKAPRPAPAPTPGAPCLTAPPTTASWPASPGTSSKPSPSTTAALTAPPPDSAGRLDWSSASSEWPPLELGYHSHHGPGSRRR